MNLGKLPFQDGLAAAAPLFADLLASRPDLPAPPQSVIWGRAIPDDGWQVLGNDYCGDCTTAAASHMVMCWTATAQGAAAPISESDTRDAYGLVNHTFRYTPADPHHCPGDTGAHCQTALNLWKRAGIGGHSIDGYALLEKQNIDHVKLAIALFGGCYFGVQLPANALPHDGQLPDWNLPAAQFNGPKVPANGHCLAGIGYDDTTITVVTWGVTRLMSWDFYVKYMDEGWSAISTRDWVRADGLTPSGLDPAQLVADFAALGQHP